MKTKILIVDDDIPVMNVVSDVLAAAGMDSILCSSGEDGLRELKSNSLDLIITDLKMPDMDGFEFSRIARNICDIPILMLSGLWRHVQAPENLDLVDEYVEKPVTLELLISQIEILLRECQGSCKVTPIREGIELT